MSEQDKMPLTSENNLSAFNHCGKTIDPDFTFSNQSKSALALPKAEIKHKLVLYKSMDYYICFCVEKEIFSEGETLLIKNSRTEEVLFDNRQNNTVNYMEYSSKATQSFDVTMQIPDANYKGWFQLLVMHRVTPK